MSFWLPLKEVSPVARLTAKQEKFVQGLIAGLSQRKAYKEAYSTKNMKDATIDNNAYKLMRKKEISTRYNELMGEHKDKALWTREDAVNTLKWLLDKSMKSIEDQDEGYVRQGTSSAIVSAIKELNELELLYPLKKKQVEKIEADINKDDTTEDKIERYFDALGDKLDVE